MKITTGDYIGLTVGEVVNILTGYYSGSQYGTRYLYPLTGCQ